MSFLSGLSRRIATNIKPCVRYVHTVNATKAISKMSEYEKKQTIEKLIKRERELSKELDKVIAERRKLESAGEKVEAPAKKNPYVYSESTYR